MHSCKSPVPSSMRAPGACSARHRRLRDLLPLRKTRLPLSKPRLPELETREDEKTVPHARLAPYPSLGTGIPLASCLEGAEPGGILLGFHVQEGVLHMQHQLALVLCSLMPIPRKLSELRFCAGWPLAELVVPTACRQQLPLRVLQGDTRAGSRLLLPALAIAAPQPLGNRRAHHRPHAGHGLLRSHGPFRQQADKILLGHHKLSHLEVGHGLHGHRVPFLLRILHHEALLIQWVSLPRSGNILLGHRGHSHLDAGHGLVGHRALHLLHVLGQETLLMRAMGILAPGPLPARSRLGKGPAEQCAVQVRLGTEVCPPVREGASCTAGAQASLEEAAHLGLVVEVVRARRLHRQEQGFEG
mmetsp:Transcript_100107/g.311293  ORF Transcript_100107/g.311293 Transcript_100107/m.311293 type:complete len:358 (+) Transcript_100107:96-1169(+)